MVYAWQNWLSARPPRVASVNRAELTSVSNNILYQWQTTADGYTAATETHYIARPMVREGKSGPPLHVHLRQTETFKVLSGTLAVRKGGQVYKVTSADGEISIPPGIRHTFYCDPSSKEDLKFRVWVSPQNLDHGFDEMFLRNFVSYLVDCEAAKMEPSLFQLLLFLYDADVVLTPDVWVPIPILTSLHHVCAYWIGQRLLGYKPTYPEYAHPKSK